MRNLKVVKIGWLRGALLALALGLGGVTLADTDVAVAAAPSAVAALSWTTVNDTVMGGRSDAKLEKGPNGELVWTGNLSLENNGGFVSIRSQKARDWSAFDGVEVAVEGGGHDVQVSLQRTDLWMRAGGYRAMVPTAKKGVTRVVIPFTAFQLKRFGRSIQGPPVTTGLKNLGQIGILIADKRPGPFKVTLSEFKPVKLPKTAQLAADTKPLLMAAIQKGVPVFNGGDAKGCADIYRDALKAAADKGHLGNAMAWSHRLASAALDKAATETPVDAAWTLRRAMDGLLFALR